MPKVSLTSALFSLFVSPAKAEEMEGDLIEMSQTRGATWLRVQTMMVAIAMAARAFTKAPVTILLIAMAGFAALYVGVLAGEVLTFTPVGAYLSSELQLSAVPFRLALLAISAAPLSFLTGFALVRLAPMRGATAGLLALVLFGGFLTALQVYVFPPALFAATILKMLLAGLPLLLGGAMAHRGRLRRAGLV